MATWASFTTIDEALTHNLMLALLGLEHAHVSGDNMLVPRYIGLRQVPGAQPPDAVLGVCGRGNAACPGHRLPLRSAKQATVGQSAGSASEARHAVGAVEGKPTPGGWRCRCVCRGTAPPRAGDPSRPRFGVFDDCETATTDERVREALGISASKHPCARWIGLRLDTQPDGNRRVVGVCHNHNTAYGCPGHALALRHLSDATACCRECGKAVTSAAGVTRANANGGDAKNGAAVLDAGGTVTGWICLTCKRRAW